jgi:hypothetical protein
MTQEEIAARRPRWEALGTPLREGLHDGRPVEAFLHTPEGQRVDVAPYWPTSAGGERRLEPYQVQTSDATASR